MSGAEAAEEHALTVVSIGAWCVLYLALIVVGEKAW